MPFVSIRKALFGHLSTLAASPPVAWENKKFDSVVGTPYLKAVLVPTGNPLVTLGPNGITNQRGMLMVTVCSPANAVDGPHGGDVLTDSILALFKAGSAITSDGIRVIVTACERMGTNQTDGVWDEITIRISWNAFISQ